MEKISRILVPFDFSETGKKGLDYAVQFVEGHNDMEIVLCYVSDNPDMERLQQEFERTRTSYGPNFRSPMSWVVGKEPLTDSILHIRETNNIDLIIMGTSGSAGSSTENTHASKLVLEADCPVLTVQGSAEEFKLKSIALVLGKDKIEDVEVLGTLLEVARRFNAMVHVLTVQNEPGVYGYSKADESNENVLEYYLENFYSHHMFMENPDVVAGIFNYAEEKDIDLIAILPRNHSKKAEPSEGLLTKELTVRSKVPVLAID
ncbi:universal stress protein [Flavobacteriaceae bacterium 3-367]